MVSNCRGRPVHTGFRGTGGRGDWRTLVTRAVDLQVAQLAADLAEIPPGRRPLHTAHYNLFGRFVINADLDLGYRRTGIRSENFIFPNGDRPLLVLGIGLHVVL